MRGGGASHTVLTAQNCDMKLDHCSKTPSYSFVHKLEPVGMRSEANGNLGDEGGIDLLSVDMLAHK